jgi:hypothetical protein
MKSTKKTITAISETIDDTDPLASLRSKLKAADLEIQNYVTALEAKNHKLQKQITTLQVDNVALNAKVNILFEENLKHGPSHEELIRLLEEKRHEKHKNEISKHS